MKKREGAANWSTSIVMVFVVAALSCATSRDQEADYFAQIASFEETNVRVAKLLDEYEIVHELSEGERVRNLSELFAGLAPLFEEYADNLASAQPPRGLQSQHQEFVRAFRRLATAAETTATELRFVGTVSAAKQIISRDFVPYLVAWSEACSSLHRGSTVGFACVDLFRRLPSLT